MFTLEIVLATALIVGSKDVDTNWLETLRPSLITLAMSGELIDARERVFLFTHNHNDDLKMLRGRLDEFASIPMIGECNRYPERKMINDLLAMNRIYRTNLVERLNIDSIYEDIIRDAITETDQLYQVWDALRDSQCDYYYVTIRRQSLNNLRDLIGAEAFYMGQMPPNVPVWHFPRR